MEVIKKSYTPNGVLIQIEDWSKDYSFYKENDTLAAYPIAKANSEYGWVRAGEEFRCDFKFENGEQTEKAFLELQSGNKKLEDFAEFTDQKHRKYLLGN